MKSLYNIESTKGEYIQPGEEARIIFVSVFNQVFPLELEEQYVALTNLILDYCVTCRTLREQDEQLYFHALGLQNVYKSLEGLEAKEPIQMRLYEAVVGALNENQTPDAYKKVNDAKEMLENRRAVKAVIDILNGKRYKCEEIIAVEREKLTSIILKMSLALQTIASFSVNGQRGIDRLHMEQEQLSVIDNLAISPLEKETLKRELISYFNMRCIAFKYVHELAEKIVLSYSKREVLGELVNGFDRKMEKGFELYMIALQTLRTFPNANRPLGRIYRSLCDSINADCNMIDIITDYLKNGVFNIEVYKDAMNSARLDANIMLLAWDVLHAIESIQPLLLQR